MAGPKESQVVLDNVVSLSWLQFITYILPLVILPYLFRILGPEKFGLIAFALAFTQYFVIITDYGFNISATKEISLFRTDTAKIRKIFSAVMTIKIVLAFLNNLLLCLIISSVAKFKTDWLIYIFSFGAVAGITLFPSWFFQGMEKMKYIANLNIVGEVVYALTIFYFIREQEDYLMVPVITSCVFLTTGLLGQYIVFRKFEIRYEFPSFHEIIKQLQAGWNIFISVVAINAYTNTRIFAVGLMTNNTLTGYYSIAEKIANVVQTFPLSSFSQAIFPRLSKIFQKSKDRAFAIMEQIQHITVIVALICLPLTFIFVPKIVEIVCGGIYPETVLSLRLLLVSVFFISANAFRVQFLLVSNKTHIYSQIHITMALIGLPLILLLIAYLNYVGAALATVFIEAGIFTMTYLTVSKLRRLKEF